jgi:hypothetical protein
VNKIILMMTFCKIFITNILTLYPLLAYLFTPKGMKTNVFIALIPPLPEEIILMK